MLYELHKFDDIWISGLNVFRYTSFRAMGAAIFAFLFCLFLGPLTIRLLRRLKLGQPLRSKEEVHVLADLHSSKKGTPTMGGILIIIAVTLSTLLWCRWDIFLVWIVLGSFLALGLVGFIDDYIKVTRKNSEGIAGRFKLIAQALVALLAGYILIHHPQTTSIVQRLDIPFMKEPLIHNMGFLTLPFFILVVMGASNAVNLTDGLDGLAAGCTATVAMTYAVIAYVAGHVELANYLRFTYVPGSNELVIFTAALAGAALGFLWYNCHPARVFMGDTGSLAIGGALAVIAICVCQPLLLVIAGGVFVLEALSVMLQVASFKLTGKRIFAMSPLHHHFELKGWTETQVTIRFWILSAGFAVLALTSLKLR
ncbi:MAG: phospho-N-acetylmuramoyl-pentapeptide-transferase [Methylacidiphilales bacterium]|nr:phospho-N-acetylmuramoyl-pentapeptide-transferase [Candidatus Methylacidiphilales bacterium]MDW8349799.1 phospho-N-acetylmuramoyl-pentapeptide-transferase [Verrucomicrobiae bacterium]